MKIFTIVTCFILGIQLQCQSQDVLQEKSVFTHQDTLRGSITPEREWWDLTYYHLDIKISPETKSISGKNSIHYQVLKPHNLMQVDLQEPLIITKVTQNGEELDVKQDGNAHFITLKVEQKKGSIQSVDVFYEGIPKEAIRAPWDGGFSWKEDNNGIPFIATSCQGLGASVWWPNKDHMYDEVDSMLISVNVPKNLTNVSNGRLTSTEKQSDNTVTTNWFVSNPINNYGVNVNIGDYVHFSEVYEGENGPLDMDYYVLRDNLVRAKNHFKEAPKMMKAFEYWFGPYPFYEDGYKLVEVPYLGMEHQSSVTYGNQYKNGYLGRDVSGSGWGLKFDFIIIHESGHEWFANNITYKDVADMWIHESFTSYSESLFVDYYFGKEASSEYVIGIRSNINNDSPIIGPYNVNKEGSGDMYYKGANMLHTLRQLIDDDEKWRQILRGLNKTFYHQTVTTEQIENYISQESGIDLKAFFNQYLRDYRIPMLEYTFEDNELKYRWIYIVEKFAMPIKVSIDNKEQWIHPTAEWKTLAIEGSDLKIDPNFYVEDKNL
ncbi:M1 family metallopeptidase [Xanthomarina sp. F2636L]|uniref:M1 family metallopeptidase n=1 Tax=Xanthomarina sp. F2636L TaxID=2996018 RepID=UPI00225E28EE|nr:M1 family metallopeptidase [Xanthomarina sp. F2636L]MCX7550155.1 M1 family metallopeptidase [Xanthomarina sp. F2636L]